MKRAYINPSLEEIGLNIEVPILVGSDLDHADSKFQNIYDDGSIADTDQDNGGVEEEDGSTSWGNTW